MLSQSTEIQIEKSVQFVQPVQPVQSVRIIGSFGQIRLCRCRYQSGQALFTPLKLRSEGLVPASAAQGADADFHSHLPRRRDSPPSCPLRSPEARETLQGPRTPTPLAPAQKIPARPAMASSGSCAAYGMGNEWRQPQGWSAYTTIGETSADLLASKLYEAAEANFPERRIRKDFSNGDADFEASFYIIRHTVMPAVLTENFMMDNVEDAAFLLSEKGKTAIIKTHIDGINRYLIAYNELSKVLF